MTTERERLLASRQAIRREYGELYDRVLQLFFESDPIGINFGDNADEYEPEVDTILPRLRACTGVDDVQSVVHEEFRRWFDADLAGGPERYAGVAREIWAMVRGTR